MGRSSIIWTIALFLLIMTAVSAEYGEYKHLNLENSTLYLAPDQLGYYYIYPNNPMNIPMKLKVEIVNGMQLIRNLDELKKIEIPPNTTDNSFPIQIIVGFPKEEFYGNLFFIEYVLYERMDGELVRYGPRGMFAVEFRGEPIMPEWDVIALRMSLLTLIIIVLLITTVIISKRYFFTEKKK